MNLKAEIDLKKAKNENFTHAARRLLREFNLRPKVMF